MSRDLLIGIGIGVLLALLLMALIAWVAIRWMRKRLDSGLQPARARTLQGWDYRMRLRTLDNEIVDAGTFRDRTLFLNFWATWCAPCVAEMPSIERLVQRLEGTGVAVACVTSEPLEKVKAFLSRRPLKIPVYVLLDETPPIFETRSIPATFIVRDGDVISQHMGAARWDTDEIVTLLRGSPPAASSHLRAYWERRLPAIEAPWTHWRLLGEDHTETFIADIAAEDVAAAVRVVAENYRSFRRLTAELIHFAPDGSCVRSKRRTVISSTEDAAR